MINRKLVGIYKYLLPAVLRDKITMLRNQSGLNTLRKNILHYYSTSSSAVDNETKNVLNYITKNPVRLFPYYFTHTYKPAGVKVYKDDKNGLYFVLHENSRMYFKRSWSKKDVRENYTNLLIEQDPQSPHRYLSEQFSIRQDDIVADVGAAEGIFSLPLINRAKKIFLFETDGEWIEALNATFSPWIEKVEIINLFVSNKNDDHCITLDEFSKREDVLFDFIKIDIDGAELSLLSGSSRILSESKKIKVAICTYHKARDEQIFSEIFKNYGMSAVPSPGYMIFYFDPQLTAPYLRRGLLRATK